MTEVSDESYTRHLYYSQYVLSIYSICTNLDTKINEQRDSVPPTQRQVATDMANLDGYAGHVWIYWSCICCGVDSKDIYASVPCRIRS